MTDKRYGYDSEENFFTDNGQELLPDEVVDGLNALEQRVEGLEDALEHCGYDPTDCIDCGGPPHNEWCRFWKLRDVVPLLFALAEEKA